MDGVGSRVPEGIVGVGTGEVNRAAYLRRRMERPRLAEMAVDFGLLAAELERCFGGTGTLPTRAQLRAITRTDLEKAIAAHGGPAAVAKRMGWRLAYKVLPADMLGIFSSFYPTFRVMPAFD